jgi:gamma-glutamylcyclotransferase (GGCT)/AIG2-like uncharacterized protein YtfP
MKLPAWRHVLVGLLSVAALLLGSLWMRVISPWGYTPPPDLAPIAAGVPHRVFAYGTLRRPVVRWLVIGRHAPTEPAALAGYLRQGLDIVPQAGARTAGEVFVVDADELRRLDRYERLGVRYERLAVTLEDGSTAWVYRLLEPRGVPR